MTPEQELKDTMELLDILRPYQRQVRDRMIEWVRRALRDEEVARVDTRERLRIQNPVILQWVKKHELPDVSSG